MEASLDDLINKMALTEEEEEMVVVGEDHLKPAEEKSWLCLHGEKRLDNTGNRLGQFIDMDFEEGGVAWGQALRTRVEIDITKPLRRGMKMAFLDRDPVWVTFKYERLLNFCYFCGRLGHGDRECSARMLGGAGVEGHGDRYGAWLRASPLYRTAKSMKGIGGSTETVPSAILNGGSSSSPMIGRTEPRNVTVEPQEVSEAKRSSGEILGVIHGGFRETTYPSMVKAIPPDLMPFKRPFTLKVGSCGGGAGAGVGGGGDGSMLLAFFLCHWDGKSTVDQNLFLISNSGPLSTNFFADPKGAMMIKDMKFVPKKEKLKKKGKNGQSSDATMSTFARQIVVTPGWHSESTEQSFCGRLPQVFPLRKAQREEEEAHRASVFSLSPLSLIEKHWKSHEQ
ncbi:hypothetical protein LOK49_LG15G00834 [Camellia lanceoleosa]|uniref:Uncharacterized protein n=1 Tax=Camellia lanceoleosa TaxID=1840588 RepID=A0ACC0F2X7_9ERIC|nr:hypothetical protein LOK49_LG15G00834 [Camellia lanceoleosa]